MSVLDLFKKRPVRPGPAEAAGLPQPASYSAADAALMTESNADAAPAPPATPDVMEMPIDPVSFDGPAVAVDLDHPQARPIEPVAVPAARDPAADPVPPPSAPLAAAAHEMSFTFIDEEGAASRWVPSAEAGHVHAIAAHLRSGLPKGAAIGLLFKSGAELVRNWFACVNAGLRPLIVQYPTRKQSRAYWFDSVTDTIQRSGIVAIVCDAYCAGLGLPDSVRIIAGANLPTEPVARPGPILPEQFSILQLSSGTTGYRKAMEFSSADLRRHTADYNQVLRLVPGQDRIVSWLPLYHDMGYVACFVMPILLGVDVVMMDAVTWVAKPERLFEAIEQYEGTICYMPNFGFEVMTRAPSRPLRSVRHWISCSEPVSAVTAQKFCAHIGAPPHIFTPCYAMAENLFAVTFGSGFDTQLIDGVEVVACGPAIPGVEIRTSNGAIWVRSPTSLRNYLGGENIRDPKGYYPTGDVGRLIGGQLYVTGRKQDVLIQAGRKFMLSDVDLKLNEAFPDVRGRGATLAIRDDRLGTETPLILIEAIDFFDRTDMPEIATRMIDVTGMDQVEVVYVPPRFLTKTSSGKINRRKTRDDWLAVQAAKGRTAGPRDAVRELRAAFGHVDWMRPMKEVLDSLSMTVVQITLETTGVIFDPTETLHGLATAITARAVTAPADAPQSIRIVSLADRRIVMNITDEDLERMGSALGCPVTLDHICLPPSPMLLSDLIFHDWFQPRLDQEAFSSVDQVLERVKEASVILVDNVAELKFLYASTYPVLSHNLERDPRADLVCVRWPNYTKQHHLLPLTIATGQDIPLEASNEALAQIGRYLGKPIYRIDSTPGFEQYCSEWEFHMPDTVGSFKEESTRMVDHLTGWIKERPEISRPSLRPGGPSMTSDLMHFCAILASKQAVDAVAEQFDSFYIGGQVASLPYLRQKLDELGKPYVMVPSLTMDVIDKLPEKYDCLIGTGAFGEPPFNIPVVTFQHIGRNWRTRNLGKAEEKLRGLLRLNEFPRSATDWFYTFTMVEKPGSNRKVWTEAMRTSKGRFSPMKLDR